MIPRIFIAAQAFQRLKLYIDLCPFEVGRLGMVESREGDLLVTSISLIRQRASDADTELDPEAVADHLLGILRQAGDLSAVRLRWRNHSPTTFLPIQTPCGGRLWQNCGRKCASFAARFPLCRNSSSAAPRPWRSRSLMRKRNYPKTADPGFGDVRDWDR